MADSSFKSVLDTWSGGEVTIVNPQSFRRGAITDAIDLETFSATITDREGEVLKAEDWGKKKLAYAVLFEHVMQFLRCNG